MATGIGGETNGDDVAGVTWGTYVDLGMPSGVTVFPASAIAEGGTYVCSTYVLGEPFIMPGNLVGACASCRHPVQMRPHSPPSLRKVCMPCVLAEGLKFPERPKPTRPPKASLLPVPPKRKDRGRRPVVQARPA